MKPKFIIVISIVIVAVGGVLWVSLFRENLIACTEEAKLCPDGSYVGRTGPNCEFTPCPEENDDGTDGGLFKTTGTIMGKVTIGPLCPVEPCSVPTPDIYLNRQIILTPRGGDRSENLPFSIKLNSDGTFQDEIPEGNYELTLTDCQFLGCEHSLPKLITIKANQTLTINVDIDTGIR